MGQITAVSLMGTLQVLLRPYANALTDDASSTARRATTWRSTTATNRPSIGRALTNVPSLESTISTRRPCGPLISTANSDESTAAPLCTTSVVSGLSPIAQLIERSSIDRHSTPNSISAETIHFPQPHKSRLAILPNSGDELTTRTPEKSALKLAIPPSPDSTVLPSEAVPQRTKNGKDDSYVSFAVELLYARTNEQPRSSDDRTKPLPRRGS